MNLAEFAEHLGVTRQAVSQGVRRGDLNGAIAWKENIEGQRIAYVSDLDRATLLWRSRHRAPALRAPARPPRPRGRPPKPRPPIQEERPVPAPQSPKEQSTSSPEPIYQPVIDTPVEAQESEQKIPEGDPLADIATARLQYEGYRALREKLQFEEESGRLIPVEQAKEIFGRLISEAKTAIMALGKHARSRIPHLSIDDVVTIEELCREALEGLASESIQKPEQETEGRKQA